MQTPDVSVLIDAATIAARVRSLGAAITDDYLAEDRVPHLVCVLKGGCVFASDLARAIALPLTMDFIAVSSYGSGSTSSGEVRLTKDLDHSLEGRDVLIVEDIVDTGLTLQYLIDLFRRRGARSLRVVTLMDKRARRRVPVELAYVGFEIPDRFVVGYGLDVNERYRNLEFIGVVEGS
jgi:hypoxanthine phosphoribosyltransferase